MDSIDDFKIAQNVNDVHKKLIIKAPLSSTMMALQAKRVLIRLGWWVIARVSPAAAGALN
jgi:hypothetical protein